MVKYGLRNIKTGDIATYSISSNSGEYCSDLEVSIGYGLSDNIWMVDTIDEALQASVTNTQWYSAHYYTPSHDYNFKSKDCEIVKFDIERKMTDVPIYTGYGISERISVADIVEKYGMNVWIGTADVGRNGC